MITIAGNYKLKETLYHVVIPTDVSLSGDSTLRVESRATGLQRMTKDTLTPLTGNCQVPTLREGKLIDPWTGVTLVPGTWTLKNSEDAARMRCPTGTYALGRVRIECYDGEIPHPLPTCTRMLLHLPMVKLMTVLFLSSF